MHKLPFYGTHCHAVVLTFRNLLLEKPLQIGIMLAGNESGIEEQRAQRAIAALREEAFAVDGRTALVDAAVETEVSHELPRMIEATNIADVPDEGSGTDGTDTRNGLEKSLSLGFRFSKLSPHLLEIFLQGKTEPREYAVDFLLGGFLVGLVHTDEVLAPGFEFHQCCVLSKESLELQDCRGIGKTVAVPCDEHRADRSRILHVGFDAAQSCIDGLGGDVGIDDGNIPAVVGEEDAEKEVVDARGFKTDLRVLLLELPVM